MTLLDEREARDASGDGGLSPQQRKARRERIRRWIFPLVALVVIVGVVVVTALVLGSGLTDDREPTADEVSADNTSQMTDAGVAFIAQRQSASFNLSDLPLTAADVGMADDDTVVATSSIGLITTTIYVGQGGGVDGEGYLRTLMRELSVTTEGGVVTSLDAELETFGWAEFPAIVRALDAGVTELGWTFTPEMRTQLEDQVGAAVRDGESYDWSIEPGTAMGVAVGADVACTGDGSCSLTYRFDPSQPATTP